MIQDYIAYLTNDLKIPHTVLPFGTDDFILILCDGVYTPCFMSTSDVGQILEVLKNLLTKGKKYDTIIIEKRRPEPNAGSVGKRGGTP